MKILIAGAGIGGLTAALCLEKAGHEVVVFEQASAFTEVGAGLQCGANAINVFDWLDLLPALEPLCVAPERVDFCDGHSGDVLYSSKWGDAYQTKYGNPYWHLYRVDLHQVLHKAFNGEVHFNASVCQYQENEKGVELELANGLKFNGDLLVGADGIKSLVRSQLLNETAQNKQPRFTGNMAWRGVVKRADLPNDFMDKITSNYMGEGKHMVIYYLRDQQLVNFVAVVEKDKHQPNATFSESESWTQQAPWQELKADFDGWHPTVQTVIDAMKHQPCFRWALHDHLPLNNWSSSRVTLLGDAAHATLPFMASGAAMAIEDARILQRCLDQTTKQNQTIEEALQCYQRNRIARTTKVQTDSVKFGKIYHIQNRFARKLAFKALSQVAKRKESFLPSYDANTVELI